MIIGMMIRRWQFIKSSRPDPIAVEQLAPLDPSKVTLRLMYVLEQSLGCDMRESAVEWTLHRNHLDSLKAALLGDYKVIVDLTRTLEGGHRNKMVVDRIIDQCAMCLNLREQVLHYRLKGITPTDDGSFLNLSLSYLERYFSLIVLNSYFDTNSKVSFGTWIRERAEIWNLFVQMRRHPNKLRAFRPIDDLEMPEPDIITSTQAPQHLVLSGDEIRVVKERSGVILGPNNILKLDHWGTSNENIEGAPNFRQVSEGAPIYATAQPTILGLENILGKLSSMYERLLWINVREEPIVYVNGEPYVLRDQWASLRNIKAYSGIASSRIEQMEERLREDILEECNIYRGRVLLHSEVSGALIPLWEFLDDPQKSIVTPKALFAGQPNLTYTRIPVTAEESPEPKDFDALSAIIAQQPANTCVIFNCQMGIGRSTTCSVIALQYLTRNSVNLGMNPVILKDIATLHYDLMNALLRGTRSGIQLKAHLDRLVDESGSLINLRTVIEDQRVTADSLTDPKQKAALNRKSVLSLKRYCLLFLFQGFLNKEPIPGGSFSTWLQGHPEYVKLLSDNDKKVFIETISDGTEAGTEPAIDDIVKTVHSRNGSVLAPMTILKYDHFPGCQKISLSDRIEGAPNFRGITLSPSHAVFGVAMPIDSAIPVILSKMEALCKPECVIWVCLREEPVVYFNGRPFVLRKVKEPIVNLEMTGIPSKRVEAMELRLKQDIESESLLNDNSVLLHEESDGKMVAVWEKVVELRTMAEVYSKHPSVQYHRIPITDEQVPIPDVFSMLSTLIWTAPLKTSFIYNCQMGRGRTTTGMVITCLVLFKKHSLSLPPPKYTGNALLDGHYKVIDKLVAVLANGLEAKAIADSAIDRCDHLQNLRECIFDQVQSCNEKGKDYLVRYFYLIAFSGYLLDSKEIGKFGDWIGERREILNLLRIEI